MSFRCMRLLRTLRRAHVYTHNVFSTSAVISEPEKIIKQQPKEIRTEANLIFNEDPDKFGTLSPKSNFDKVLLEDEGDIKEDKIISDFPLASQKLTTGQYADLIKQYIKHKRLKEAINVLEVRMLQEDRVQPENYIFNILIGACADVGYTKKAFKLYNDMKRRALKPTGDTYTCLFHACGNSPWKNDGLKLATHLRELIIEKGIELNLTNYNSMIKAFGRCGDLSTAFKIADEMVSKGIKIRVHTFNHLLQACISDKDNGLRHALIVWRKMLKLREKPNIYSFNLMLKCVKDCNLGSQADIQELIGVLQEQSVLESRKDRILMIESEKPSKENQQVVKMLNEPTLANSTNNCQTETNSTSTLSTVSTNNSIIERTSGISIQIVTPRKVKDERMLPNLLSKELRMQQVLSLQTVQSLQEKFAVIGGQDDFLKEMEEYSVKPDVKTFTQMLPLLDDSREAEDTLLTTMKALDIRADISFYNMLIKKRCLRSDYDDAFAVIKLIQKESKIRKRRFPDRKRLHLKPNIMTYGVLAMACKTKENAEKLLKEMDDAQIKVNIEILGTLLRQGTASVNFGYVLYIINLVKAENLQPNRTFLKHLEDFNDKCRDIIKPENGKPKCTEVFIKSFKIFSIAYTSFLKEINVDEALKPEHPWAQFNETYPETVQRQKLEIKQPKRYFKKNRKFIKYKPAV